MSKIILDLIAQSNKLGRGVHSKFVSSCTADRYAAVQLRLELTTFACTHYEIASSAWRPSRNDGRIDRRGSEIDRGQRRTKPAHHICQCS
jgi:hypothetical protein